MKKIKVCTIITKLELGGAQKIAMSLCKDIDKEKFETFMICGCGGMLDNDAVKNNKVFFVKDLIREINPIKDLKALSAIYSILRKEKPDIVHTHSSKAGILGRLAAKFAGIKTIHAIHGFAFNDFQNKMKKYFYIFLEKICAFISDILIVECSQTMKKGLKYNIGNKNKYKLIKLGLDFSEFSNYSQGKLLRKELNIKDDEVLVTTIGPFKPQKNLSDFIKIASLVHKKNVKIKFAITGDGQERLKLETLINELNLKDVVYLIGWRRDIPNILYSTDIFLMTSLWEGMPIVSIDSMYCGVPMIANAVDGQIDLIKDNVNGFLIKPYDIETACSKILYLVNNPDIKMKMEQEAKNSIDDTFSIDYMIKEHEKLYMEL